MLVATVALLAWGVAPAALTPGWAGLVREALRSDHMSAAEIERAERGYYEALEEGRRPDQLDSGKSTSPGDFGPLTVPAADVREYALKPGLSTRHRGASWSTNARGMRDRDYPDSRPSGTLRIALAGDSIAAGWGVDDGRGFEPTWELMLNRRSKVEVWNHAVPGLAPGQRWEHFAREGWASGPDLVVFQGTPADFGWDDRKLRSLLPKGIGWDVASYRRGLASARVRPGRDEASYKHALRRHREAVLSGVYRTAVEDCNARGVPSVYLLLPRVGKPTNPADRARLVKLAEEAGFARIVDLTDAFEGYDEATLAISPDDFHPNALGHARLARLIDDALREDVKNLENLHRPHDPGRSWGEDPR